MKEIKLPKLFCKRCKKYWIPRKEQLPEKCAKCGNPYWNKDRVYKLKEGK